MAESSTDTSRRKIEPYVYTLRSLAVAWGRIVEGDVFASLSAVIADENVNAVLVRGLDFARVDGMVLSKPKDANFETDHNYDEFARYQWAIQQPCGRLFDIKSNFYQAYQWSQCAMYFVQLPHEPNVIYAIPEKAISIASLSRQTLDISYTPAHAYALKWPQHTWASLLCQLATDTPTLRNTWSGSVTRCDESSAISKGSNLHEFRGSTQSISADSILQLINKTASIRKQSGGSVQLKPTPYQPYGGDFAWEFSDGESKACSFVQHKTGPNFMKAATFQPREKFDHLIWDDTKNSDLNIYVRDQKNPDTFPDCRYSVHYQARYTPAALEMVQHLLETLDDARAGWQANVHRRWSSNADELDLEKALATCEETDKIKATKLYDESNANVETNLDANAGETAMLQAAVERIRREFNRLSEHDKRAYMLPLGMSSRLHPLGDMVIIKVDKPKELWDDRAIWSWLHECPDLTAIKGIVVRIAPRGTSVARSKPPLHSTTLPLANRKTLLPITRQPAYILGYQPPPVVDDVPPQVLFISTREIQWPQALRVCQWDSEPDSENAKFFFQPLRLHHFVHTGSTKDVVETTVEELHRWNTLESVVQSLRHWDNFPEAITLDEIFRAPNLYGTGMWQTEEEEQNSQGDDNAEDGSVAKRRDYFQKLRFLCISHSPKMVIWEKGVFKNLTQLREMAGSITKSEGYNEQQAEKEEGKNKDKLRVVRIGVLADLFEAFPEDVPPGGRSSRTLMADWLWNIKRVRQACTDATGQLSTQKKCQQIDAATFKGAICTALSKAINGETDEERKEANKYRKMIEEHMENKSASK